MARSKATGTVLPPAAKPAGLTEDFAVAQVALAPEGDAFPAVDPNGNRIAWGDESEPDGIVRYGETECPSCEGTEGMRWYVREGYNVRQGVAYPFWWCCFTFCMDGRHAFLDGDACSGCGDCPEHCDCCECSACGDKTSDSGDFCSECDCCSSCCECARCGDCGELHESCECNKMGSITVVPWEGRGRRVAVGAEPVDVDKYLRNDPLQAMADFYLLEYMTILPAHDWSDYWVSAAVLSDEARAIQRKLVTLFDGLFIEYVDMVVGGEVRHHRCMGQMSRSRQVAWSEWRSIREALGLEALEDAASLFEDMANSDGYGGPPWAAAARIVRDRLAGTLDAKTFVDRVFSMQHNGGSLLNKVKWGGFARGAWGTDRMTEVGNAHAARETDLATLLFLASEPVERLFGEWWAARNRLFASLNARPEVLPSWRKNVHKTRPDGDVDYAYFYLAERVDSTTYVTMCTYSPWERPSGDPSYTTKEKA